jgi:hypothetical protein
MPRQIASSGCSTTRGGITTEFRVWCGGSYVAPYRMLNCQEIRHGEHVVAVIVNSSKGWVPSDSMRINVHFSTLEHGDGGPAEI